MGASANSSPMSLVPMLVILLSVSPAMTVIPGCTLSAICSLSNSIYILPFSTRAAPVAKLSMLATELQISMPASSRITAVRISQTAGLVTWR